jgi:cell division protein FtsW (lipid II flippase)
LFLSTFTCYFFTFLFVLFYRSPSIWLLMIIISLFCLLCSVLMFFRNSSRQRQQWWWHRRDDPWFLCFIQPISFVALPYLRLMFCASFHRHRRGKENASNYRSCVAHLASCFGMLMTWFERIASSCDF